MYCLCGGWYEEGGEDKERVILRCRNKHKQNECEEEFDGIYIDGILNSVDGDLSGPGDGESLCGRRRERMEREGGGRHAACGALYTAGFTTDNDRPAERAVYYVKHYWDGYLDR